MDNITSSVTPAQRAAKASSGAVSRPPQQKRIVVNHTILAIALRELVTGPTTRAELAQATGLNYKTACALVAALHRAKLVRIVSSEYKGTVLIHHFQFDPDKPDFRYRRKTNAENQRNARKRRKQAELFNAIVSTPAQ